MSQEAKDDASAMAIRLGAMLLVGLGLFYGWKWWIGQDVVSDAEARYEIAVRSGSQADACHEAELVAAAQMYAKREDDWRRWKDIASRTCAAVSR